MINIRIAADTEDRRRGRERAGDAEHARNDRVTPRGNATRQIAPHHLADSLEHRQHAAHGCEEHAPRSTIALAIISPHRAAPPRDKEE